ncbi:MAG: hypothetical protein DYG83_14190 [Candidatus Brocadia sp. AMX2]|uniref:Uncharacterized protein n=1 Tax=Candidatus Brocadia sinica JPN1 TaxID=1197129 RepID=A0ABQ0JUM6_9BACT|nr:MAG: hypothetical protein EDM70_05885 [Candidatus Brocadia sp. AMX2]MBC6932798.1 hypothetical protein [Candidatus Brocadia sp.]MBL1169977.1 hypothetical protein [Candidatus Brocadia sp. AMX1]GAN32456.1 hypothetical protein BROSI_A0971 [Candidatus Brocadia sinica JPN1]GJQ19131.1 MAG: hypothetical protein HBSIN01_30900 [Candidatus Brocadia sinica]
MKVFEKEGHIVIWDDALESLRSTFLTALSILYLHIPLTTLGRTSKEERIVGIRLRFKLGV